MIAYEALPRSLFSTSRATGLCRYNRQRTPHEVIDGAVATHPLMRVGGGCHRNPFYAAASDTLPRPSLSAVEAKLAELDSLPTAADRRARRRKPIA